MNSFSNLKPVQLNEISLNHTFKSCSIFDYKSVISCGNLVLLLGCGVCIYVLAIFRLIIKFFFSLKRDYVYELELDSFCNQSTNDPSKSVQYSSNRGYKNWKKLTNYKIELPKGTLLFAEKVVEYRVLIIFYACYTQFDSLNI